MRGTLYFWGNTPPRPPLFSILFILCIRVSHLPEKRKGMEPPMTSRPAPPAPAGPDHLVLDLTRKCNLRCFMCNVHAHDDGDRYESMPDEVFDRLRPVFPHLRRITLGGNGEPFLDSRLFARLETIRALNPGVFVEVFSNATLLRDEREIRRALAGIDLFRFSVNAFSAGTYERTMVGARFAALQENLQRFAALRTKCGRRVRSTAECIVMRRNIDELPEGVAFCRETGLDELVFKPLWVIDEETRAEFVRPSDDPDRDRLESSLRRAWLGGRARGVDVDAYRELRALYGIADLPTPGRASLAARLLRRGTAPGRAPAIRLPRRWSRLPCTDPWLTAQVFENGYVCLCCQGVTEIGSLKDAAFDELWHGPEARAYREGLASGRYHQACLGCSRVLPTRASAYEKA